MTIYLQLTIITLFLLGLYYMTGASLKHILRLKYKGFNVLVGFLSIFGLFHVLAVIPTIRHASFDLFANYLLPIVFIMAIMVTIIRFLYFRHFKFESVDKWLLLTVISFLILYFSFDFIVYGDASFYLPLIRQNIGVDQVYLDGGSPWSGNLSLNLVSLHALVTYELFIGSLASLFRIDATIFTVNVISVLNIIIIFTSWFSFFSHLFKKDIKARNGYLIFLFIFMLANVNIDRLFHPLNGFLFMTNIYTGKSLYLYAVLPLIFIIINKVSKLTTGTLFPLLFVLNLILPGLTAYSLSLQLILNLSVLTYFLIIRQPEDKTVGKFVIVTVLPLALHYIVMVFMPSFNQFGFLLKLAFLFLTILIAITAYYLVLNNGIIIKSKKRLIRLTFIYIYSLVAILSTGYFIYFVFHYSFRWDFVGSFIRSHVIQGINLFIFYFISVMGMRYIKYDDDREHQYNLIFFWLPILIVLLFINPFTGFITARFVTSFRNYHLIVFLFPLGYLAAYFLASKKHYKHILIYLLFIIFPGNTIFNDFHLLNRTEDDYLYRIPRHVVDVGHYFELQDDRCKIIGVTDIVRGVRIVSTNVELVIDEYDLKQREDGLYNNEELLNLFLTINDQTPFIIDDFKSVIKEYEIDRVIVYRNSAVSMQLSYHGYDKEIVGKYAIYTTDN